MIDLQASTPKFAIPINSVGIKRLKHPVIVQLASGVQSTHAVFDLGVQLPADQRGTHMSRFIEIINQQTWQLSLAGVQELLGCMCQHLQAEAANLHASFDIFLTKHAPVSQVKSVSDYAAFFQGHLQRDLPPSLQVGVKIPVTTLCPCSKAISKYGAHNQRAIITLTATSQHAALCPESLIQLAEKQASCEIYSLLKRQDEKFVTEAAYENPVFVEDLARNIAHALQQDPRIEAFSIEVENFESIHNHSAVATIVSTPNRT